MNCTEFEVPRGQRKASPEILLIWGGATSHVPRWPALKQSPEKLCSYANTD